MAPKSYLGQRPRLLGAILTALAGIGLFVTLDGAHLARHGLRGSQRPFMTWFALLAGALYVLVVGYPRGEDGRAPTWWKYGLVATMSAGAVVGLIVYYR